MFIFIKYTFVYHIYNYLHLTSNILLLWLKSRNSTSGEIKIKVGKTGKNSQNRKLGNTTKHFEE